MRCGSSPPGAGFLAISQGAQELRLVKFPEQAQQAFGAMSGSALKWPIGLAYARARQ